MLTWVLYRIARPFLSDNHPLKTPISLSKWKKGRTDQCRHFDILLWLWLICILVGVIIVAS